MDVEKFIHSIEKYVYNKDLIIISTTINKNDSESNIYEYVWDEVDKNYTSLKTELITRLKEHKNSIVLIKNCSNEYHLSEEIINLRAYRLFYLNSETVVITVSVDELYNAYKNNITEENNTKIDILKLNYMSTIFRSGNESLPGWVKIN